MDLKGEFAPPLFNGIINRLLRTSSFLREVRMDSQTLMRIQEANSGPPKNVNLNQMQEVDYKAGHCG